MKNNKIENPKLKKNLVGMEAIMVDSQEVAKSSNTVTKSSNSSAKSSNTVTKSSSTAKSGIEMKSYVLDDLKALKKKWNMINHKPEIDINGEAMNGSSINVDMKTSIFELMKAGILDSLKKENDIRKDELLTTSKAYSKNGEEADVEYHVEVTFEVKDRESENEVLYNKQQNTGTKLRKA